MSNELKDCPFCGEPVSLIEEDKRRPWAIVCEGCGITNDEWAIADQLIVTWNARPIEDALHARITELEEILEGKEKLHAASAQAALDHINYSVSKIVYDRVKAEAVKLNEVVSIQASRINELERQLFFLRRELERHEQK